MSPTLSRQNGKLEFHTLGQADWIILGLLLVGLAVFYWLLQFRDFGYADDATIYLGGARSLAEGKGYRMITYAGAPRIGLYPPFQSWFLSLIWRANPNFPANVSWLNAGMIVLALSALACGFVLVRKLGLPLWLSGLLTLCWAVSAMWYQWIFMFLSDIGFTGLCLALCLLWLRQPPLPNGLAWLLTGLGMAIAYWWRTAALPLIAGLVIIAARQCSRGRLAPLLLFMFPAGLAYIGWWWMSRGTVDYWTNFQLWWEPMGGWDGYFKLQCRKLLEFASGAPFWEMICPPIDRVAIVLGRKSQMAGQLAKLAAAILFWAMALFAVIGYRQRQRPFEKALLWLGAIYFLQVIVVPIDAWFSHRYCFILLLPVLVWAWHGFSGTAFYSRLPSPRTAAAALLALVIVANLYLTWVTWRHWQDHSRLEELHELADWTRHNTPSTARIAASPKLPTIHFSTWIGRSLVVDYMDGPIVPVAAIRITHAQQGNMPADYVLVSVEGLVRKKNLPAGLLKEVKASRSGQYRLHKVDPVLEVAYRKSVLDKKKH